MTVLDLLIVAFASLYAAYAITKTYGAFGMFVWIRERFPLGGLTSCIVCAAIWCAAAFYLLMLTPLHPIVEIFAVAGAAVVIGHYVGMAQQNPD